MRGFDYMGTMPQRGVLIKINNPTGLAAQKGGAAGSIAAAFIPQTVEGKILDEITKKLRDGFKNEGVDAEVTVVEPAGYRGTPAGFVEGAAAGALAVAAAWAVKHFLF